MIGQLLAQTTSSCTVNGVPTDCSRVLKASGGIFAGFGIFFILMFVLSIINLVFLILSLVHLVKHEDVKDRVLWIILVIFVPIAAWIYYLSIRKSYERDHAGLASGTTTPVMPQPPVVTPPIVNPPAQPPAPESPPSNDQQPPINPVA